jgi:thiamine-monophosphate kinase
VREAEHDAHVVLDNQDGNVRGQAIIRRGGARPGDTIFVTGTIGDSALGLEVLRGGLPELDAASAGFLVDRYRLPLPRVTIGPPTGRIGDSGA